MPSCINDCDCSVERQQKIQIDELKKELKFYRKNLTNDLIGLIQANGSESVKRMFDDFKSELKEEAKNELRKKLKQELKEELIRKIINCLSK